MWFVCMTTSHEGDNGIECKCEDDCPSEGRERRLVRRLTRSEVIEWTSPDPESTLIRRARRMAPRRTSLELEGASVTYYLEVPT